MWSMFILLIYPELMQMKICKQVMINLLDNAIKYTPPEGRILIRCYRRTAVLLLLSLTPVWYSRESIPRVFERFTA